MTDSSGGDRTVKLRALPDPAGTTHAEPIVLPRTGNEISYPNCLVVDTQPSAASGTTVLASIDHFVEREGRGGFPWEIKQITDQMLPFSEAMDLAKQYAREHQVPVILVNQDGFSSDSERRQTDTAVIRMKPK